MTPNKRSRVASLAAMAGMTLLALACSTDDILVIEDPDIINPSNVRSAAGANAVRLGALSRFVGLTTGDESLFFLGGLFTDEWLNGDSFIYKQEVDQRVTPKENSGTTGAMRTVHRVRLSAQQAVALIDEWNPTAPGWHTGEMFMLQAYALNIMAEHFCDGMIISNVVEGREEYGDPMTATQVYERALALANDGLARVTGSTADDVRVRSALALTKGRILVNLNRQAEGATAVAGVATSFKYMVYHSQTTWTNQFWSLNLNSGRYSVSEKEGTNGMNFVSAKDPRVPVCETKEAACKAIGATRTNRDDLTTPLNIFMSWAGREQAVPVMQGVDARMIEAEAKLKAGDAPGALATLNAARATVAGLTPLADAGTAAARVDQLFRERAFWQFGRGYRTGDMRRLVRQYGRTEATVFPVGAWHKGGNYGTAVDFPLPQAEENNPNLGLGKNCMARGA
jgi:hypothetical protein